ncbi:MAG: RluA family pseudouridine synthase [Thermodesulfobacteriota bacterium]
MVVTPFAVTVEVDEPMAGRRLDKMLNCRPELASLSRNRLQNLILTGKVLVGGETRKRGYRLKLGEEVRVLLEPPQPCELKPCPVAFAILHEDGDIIVVDKPAGLVMHPSPGHADHTLVHGLLHHCGDLSGIGGEMRPGIVHRLDKDTSGVVVVAKNDLAHQHLARQFHERTTKKIYHALVVGSPPQAEGRVETLLGRHPIQRKKMAVLHKNGRRAVSNYRLLASSAELSLLEVVIETGRTHQIRVHMAHLGCPVLADPIYGGKKTGKVPAPRLCLHASSLAIVHPRSQETMQFMAPLPPDIGGVLAENGLDGVL